MNNKRKSIKSATKELRDIVYNEMLEAYLKSDEYVQDKRKELIRKYGYHISNGFFYGRQQREKPQ